MASPEAWRPVVGYEGAYEVSDLGRVRSMDRLVERPGGVIQPRRSKMLTLRPHPQGYRVVTLYRAGVPRAVMAHILVAEAFIGLRPEGMDVCHHNDIKDDNRPANLRYDTRSANMKDAVRNGAHQWSSRTHCKHGHEFTDANTYVWSDGKKKQRCCRTCSRLRARLAHMEKAAASA